MTRLVGTELLKLRTTRLVWILAVAMAGLTILTVGITLAFADETLAFALSTEEGQRNLLSAGSTAQIFVLVLGIMAMSGEYKQSTITATFLAVPVRRRVMVSKLVAYLLVGLGFAVIANVLTLLVGLIGLSVIGEPLVLSGGDLAGQLAGSLGAAALYGALGVGAGALIVNQIAALVGVLIEQMVVEPLIGALFSDVGRFFPSTSASILAGSPTSGTLPLWGAALVLAGWVIALAAGGTLVTERKDIT